ncbi:MAG: nodulation protein NfeD [Chloroflexota bacterium]
MMGTIRRLLIFITLFAATALHAQNDGDIVLLEYDGIISQTTASYFERGIATAVSDHATAVLINLDTPGGDLGATINIVQLFRNATVPIIVYITPEGGQAASAGSVITAAAHVAAMSPGTVIGAASPINGDGSDIGETLYRKQVEDLKATMRTLTARRGDAAVATAEAMIEDARAVTADEALQLGLIDLIADDSDQLLAEIDGMAVTVDGRDVVLATGGREKRPLTLTLTERILAALTNPLLLGILITIGAQALIFEVTHPGFGAPGIVGILCIALALYGFGQLPVNYLGLGLIALAFILLVTEAFTPTHGVLGVGGAISLFAGLLVLFNSPGSPDFIRLSIPSAIGITLFTASFFAFILYAAIRTRKLPAVTGAEGLVGQLGPVRRPLVATASENLYQGSVLVNGELWRAQSDEPLDAGAKVVVKSLDGFTLHVKKV